MFYLLISVPLLLLGASGHSISKLEINNTNTDVYEIKEDSSSNTIAFVNPKSEQQTLREIVYYHLIETPYGQSEGPTKLISEDGPDFDDTARPFTNGHGFPFLASAEQGPNDDFETEDLNPSLRASQEPAKEPPLLIDGGEEEVVYYYDEDIEEKSSDANKGLVTTQVLEGPGEKAEIRTIATPTTEPHASIEEQTAVPDDGAVTATPPVAEDLETKARLARKLLFESAKERYHNNDNTQVKSPSSVRRKREISKHIPEGPRLAPLNLDSLPPYLRNLISTEEPQPRSRNYAPDSSEERMEEIHRKMKDMMSKSRKEKKEESQPAPRTYGMNLTEDHGYVWNNINPESGFHFTVEASESIEVDETSEVNDKENPTKDDIDNQKESEESPEPQDSLEEKQRVSKYVENNTEEDVKPKGNAVEADPEKSHEKHEDDKDKPINIDNEEDKDLASEDKDASFEEKGRKRKPPKERDAKIDELLENEQFWSWLTDWTSAYLDVLTEYIEEAAQAEVENQMKSYEKSHKKKNKKPVEKNEKPKPDDEHSQKDNQTTTEHIIDKNTTKIENKIEKEQKPATNQTLDTLKEEDLSQKQKEGDTKKPDANNIEDKVEPSKNSTKEENTPPIKKNPNEYTKIQAENLYGNSVGSEQVTNIFIFYPNKDINKIVEEIKNNTDSLTNVFEPPKIDEIMNVPDKNEEDVVENSSKAPADVKDITTDAPIASTETPKVDEGDSSTSNTIDVTTKAPDRATSEKPSSSKMPATAVTEQNPSEITSTTEALKIATSHESKEETEIDNPDVDSDDNIDEGSVQRDNSPIDKTETDNKENTNSENASGNEQTTPKTEDKESLTIEASENEDASDKPDSKEKIETSTEPA